MIRDTLSRLFGRHCPGWALRICGLALALIALLCLRHLYWIDHENLSRADKATDIAFAAFGFLGLSFGTSLIWLGEHCYDEVELSERWRRVDDGRQP